MPDHTAFPPPPAPADAQPLHQLTAGQAELQEKVQAHFEKDGYKIPGVQDGALTDDEKFWLTYECTLRYLRGTKWNLKNAIDRIEGSLKWRREFGIYTLSAADVEPEAVTGKEVTFGYDKKRRPAVYLIPSRQNTEESPRQIQYTVWMLERAIELTGQGVESVLLMINFAARGKSPSMSTSKTVLNILQSHYPERLGAALILNVPFILNAFFKLISPLIDPVTREKMKFNPKAVEDGIFDADNLFQDSGWGGAREFVWDHDKYWPAFVQMCAEIREKQYEQWRKLGARIGTKEWDIKASHDVPASSVGSSAATAEPQDAQAVAAKQKDVPEVDAPSPATHEVVGDPSSSEVSPPIEKIASAATT
ncbi:CRAL/TRIO domain-containing protein [Auriscalpium vulgare]|uniref:CRAL/TRIO domain-containing protein n=1 Tax=Auriscalpium vulgare TaxID=40419 RepID=A0ACB8RMT5_9AGAM|nr:CRAL/TRIO domain-containing protein [Auriscalpium vulgare]